jgi:hypothetical protein
VHRRRKRVTSLRYRCVRLVRVLVLALDSFVVVSFASESDKDASPAATNFPVKKMSSFRDGFDRCPGTARSRIGSKPLTVVTIRHGPRGGLDRVGVGTVSRADPLAARLVEPAIARSGKSHDIVMIGGRRIKQPRTCLRPTHRPVFSHPRERRRLKLKSPRSHRSAGPPGGPACPRPRWRPEGRSGEPGRRSARK